MASLLKNSRKTIFAPQMKATADPTMRRLLDHLSKKSSQCLVVSPDPHRLEQVKKEIAKEVSFTCVHSTDTKDESPAGKLFFIEMCKSGSLAHQSLMYYYLDLPPTADCHVCLLATTVRCLDSLEKRVRSRFTNQTFFFPFAAAEGCADDVEASLYASLAAQEARRIMKEYSIPEYSHDTMFSLLSSVHLFILILGFKHTLSEKNVAGLFKKERCWLPELKNVQAHAVVFAFLELREAGLIAADGRSFVDFNELRTYIEKNSEVYMSRALKMYVPSA